MSFKPIELQLSTLKTQENVKLQGNLQQRPNIEQGLLMSQLKSSEIKKRTKAQETEKSILKEENTMRKPRSSLKQENKGNFIDMEI